MGGNERHCKEISLGKRKSLYQFVNWIDKGFCLGLELNSRFLYNKISERAGTEMDYTKEQIEFLKSRDFMKLGQAVGRGQWQSAAMTIQRMDKKAKEAGMEEFCKSFTGIRQCINRKDCQEVKQILAVVVNKRARHLNAISWKGIGK